MTLLFQSIPFSLAVMWRFLVVFPFILLPAFVLIAGTGLIFPGLGFLVFCVFYNFCTLVGIRAGLGALNMGNTPDLIRLLRWSLIFSLFQIACIAFFAAMGWAVVLVGRMLGYDELGALVPLVVSGNWSAIFSAAPLLVGVAATVLLSATAVWSMSLVPQAAAARSSSPKAHDSNLFAGFGAGFFGLFVVTTLSSLLIVWTDASTKMMMFFAMILRWAYVQYSGLLELPPSFAMLFPGFIGFMIWVWASCWVFGAAALVYARKVERGSVQSAAPASARLAQDDLRAMREARERAQQGQLD